ncbi:ADP-ribosylglycohydrolase family protein [Amycolatopsis suaedae]|uniref:ADP-ribosylglycohydrolase family protein n=2 Tax=Amycolatopsis suaedae TaxID=2510978 RepID=A0A4Q7JDI9_9PSEU|nr:ADP-ribosylglycohydrolase family protein [Amycolatopsis suaedae]
MRVELYLATDRKGRRYLTRQPTVDADPETLRPAKAWTPYPPPPPLPPGPETTQPVRVAAPAALGPVSREKWRGSLLAGAVGDALGAPIESKPMDRIRQATGPEGLTDYIADYDGVGRITDDTQMTLFTLDGLIRERHRRLVTGQGDMSTMRLSLQLAYQRWLHTQGVPWEKARGPRDTTAEPDGWLMGIKDLFRRRAPGATCFFALKGYGATGEIGTFTHTLNNSKGCGGVMRAAPAALWSDDPAEVFEVGAAAAALTHSHPSGYLSAGALAVLVHHLVRGADLHQALDGARTQLVRWNGHEEQSGALDAAVALAGRGKPTPELVAQLGRGGVGEGALAIAVYAALATDNPNAALLASVNHDGDSDSTGSICGNIVGAWYGEGAIRPDWLEKLQLRTVVETAAEDALAVFTDVGDTDWRHRYPLP